MKATILLTVAIFIFLAAPSMAKLNYYNPYDKNPSNNKKTESNSISKSLIITPIGKCYKRLNKKTVNEIKKNYIKPYKECLRRVKLKEKYRRIKVTGNKNIEEFENNIDYDSKKENEETETAEEKKKEHDPCEIYEVSYEAYVVCKNKILKNLHKMNMQNKNRLK